MNDCFVTADLSAKLYPYAEVIVADKDYDSEYIRGQIAKKGTRAVIPESATQTKQRRIALTLSVKCLYSAKIVLGSGNAYNRLKKNYESLLLWHVDICG